MFESLLLVALATFVTEDLTCVATGLLVARGKIGFLAGTAACMAGIFAGDILLFLAGRFAARPVFRYVSEQKVRKASEWFAHRGMAVVFLSRFAPGLRLPTYVAAGLLRTRFWSFAFYFLLAAAVWTPLLVGGTALLGDRLLRTALSLVGSGALALALILGLAVVLRKLVTLSFSFRARRRLVGFVLRKIRWEFWPPWAAYIPVAPFLLYLACKHRSLTLFTAANPGMPSGGFVGESKGRILEYLSQEPGTVAAFAVIPASLEVYARIQMAAAFLAFRGAAFPVVLKPDVGERGSGVIIARDQGEIEAYLKSARGDTIIQEYVPGLEFGVFYVRYPGEPQGRIFSITEKCFPEVTGDGESTVEQLILRDPRAVCMFSAYESASRRPLGDVPRAGESVRLVELGSHCRGSIFLDGRRYKTRALEQAIDRISGLHPGFYLGRFDIRASSVEALRDGRGFKVIELNGVSAEATHVYDPAVSLLEAYRVIRAVWRMAFEIGSANRRRGARPMSLEALLNLIWNVRQVRPAVSPSGQAAGRRGPLENAGAIETVD
jgi:membrane protein DedA with SNARE-associated domain